MGQVEFRILKGFLSVNGRIFDDKSLNEWQSVFSPRSTALMSFEPQTEVEIEFRTLENGLDAIQNCQPTFGNLLVPETEFVESFEEVVKGFYLLKREAEESLPMPLMKISDEWLEVLETVKTAASPIIFVCGHRKVGKSSFSRFLLNGLLNENQEVEFVDLDPGQTEFTPAGFIARKSFTSKGKKVRYQEFLKFTFIFVFVLDALLGPPFTHLQVPDEAIYLASSNGSEVPLIYCRALKSLKQNMKNGRPVVINTMGWMTGLGLELIQYALQVFRPTHVLAFMALETEDTIRKCLMTNTFGLDGALSSEEADSVYVRYMGNPVGDGPRGKHSPADQRNLAYWAYFFGIINSETGTGRIDRFDFKPLSALRPVVVPLSQVQLTCTSREIDLFDLIKVRSGCDQIRLLESWLLMRVVGLARDEKFIGGSRWVNFLSNSKVGRIAEMSSVGVGLVRAVVRVSDHKIHLHILTPLPLPILSITNTLILGSQQLPLPMISADSMSLQAEAVGFSTQMVGTDVNGAGARKTRHNMMRRK